MLQIENNGFFYNIGDESHNYGVRIVVGDKFFVANDPYNKESCLELEKHFQAAGFKTRVAQHGETKEWSVAIIG